VFLIKKTYNKDKGKNKDFWYDFFSFSNLPFIIVVGKHVKTTQTCQHFEPNYSIYSLSLWIWSYS